MFKELLQDLQDYKLTVLIYFYGKEKMRKSIYLKILIYK